MLLLLLLLRLLLPLMLLKAGAGLSGAQKLCTSVPNSSNARQRLCQPCQRQSMPGSQLTGTKRRPQMLC